MNNFDFFNQNDFSQPFGPGPGGPGFGPQQPFGPQPTQPQPQPTKTINVNASEMMPSTNNKPIEKKDFSKLIEIYKKNKVAIGILIITFLLVFIFSSFLTVYLADIFLVLNNFFFGRIPFLGIIIWLFVILLMFLGIFKILGILDRPFLALMYFLVIIALSVGVYFFSYNKFLFLFSFAVFLILFFDIFFASELFKESYISSDIASNVLDEEQKIVLQINTPDSDINIDKVLEEAPQVDEEETQTKLQEVYEEIKEWVEDENINYGILVDVYRRKMVGVSLEDKTKEQKLSEDKIKALSFNKEDDYENDYIEDEENNTIEDRMFDDENDDKYKNDDKIEMERHDINRVGEKEKKETKNKQIEKDGDEIIDDEDIDDILFDDEDTQEFNLIERYKKDLLA